VSEGYPIQGRLSFDEAKVAEGLGLSVDDVRAYFRDGRRAQPIVERRLLQDFSGNGWRAETVMGGGRCLVFERAHGFGTVQRFDVRVVTEELSFAPSWMKGTGRSFNPDAFQRYYAPPASAEAHGVSMVALGFDVPQVDPNARAGVFVVDVPAWPLCPYWRVPSHAILEWAAAGRLGSQARMKRPDVARLLEGFKP